MNTGRGLVWALCRGLIGDFPSSGDGIDRAFSLKAALIGLIAAVAILCISFGLLFPFQDDWSAVISIGMIPLLSGLFIFLPTALLSIASSKSTESIRKVLVISAVQSLAHAFLLASLNLPFHVSELQEVVLTLLLMLFLIGIMWQANVLYSAWTQGLGIHKAIAAPLAGLVNLVALGSSMWIWYEWIGADSLSWDAMFFL